MQIRRPILLAAAAAAVLVTVPAAVLARGADSGPSAPAVAQAVAIGSGFTYQGRLTDAGAPANGVYDLRFVLYDDEIAGASVGAVVEKADVQVTNGIFVTNLDFGATAFTGDARWMEIAVRPGTATGAYTALSPRQAISSAPYALYAKAAGSIAFPVAASASPTAAVLDLTNAGTGVAAKLRGLPVALELDGGVRVSGPAANRPAFVQTVNTAVTGGNTCLADKATVIDGALANGDPAAILTVTGVGDGVTVPPLVAVAYNVAGCTANRWIIYAGSAFTNGTRFNVTVVKAAAP